MDLQRLPKLRRTVEFSYTKIPDFINSSRYFSIWDHELNHDDEDIHTFSIRYNAQYDRVEFTVIDIDTDAFVKYEVTDTDIKYYNDAWSEYSYTEKNYHELHDESYHFQQSTVREVMPYEFIELFITAMNTINNALGEE